MADSYRDHSAFLTGKSRYAFLFELDPNDYKGWSRGLKKAGYATNPKYADLLIKIIEDNELYRLDQGIELARNVPQTGSPGSNHAQSNSEDLFEDGFAISSGDRSAGVINRVDYIVTKPGDTFGSLTREYGLMPWELPRYNDLEAEVVLQPGWILYLQPKRNQAEQGNQYHVVREGEASGDISQTYGVKLEKILEMNGLDKDAQLQAGDQIWLRKKKMP